MPNQTASQNKQNQEAETSTISAIEPIERSRIMLLLQLLFSFLIIEAAFILIVAILLTLTPPPTIPVGVVVTLAIIYILKGIISAYAIIWLALNWESTKYYITGHQLIRREGIITVNEKVYELQNIRSVFVEESWLGRLFNYGTLLLTIAISGVREDLRIPGVADPRKYEKLCALYMEKQAEMQEQN